MPVLGDPTAVDVRVTDVRWQPHGRGLIYSREEGEGSGLGVYAVGQKEGKVLIHLNKGDTWDSQWFDSDPIALVTLHRKIDTPAGPQTEITIHTFDTEKCEDRLLFTRIVPLNESWSVEADTSPSLVHAIFTLNDGKTTSHMVLPTHGNKLISGSEIDKAIKDGFGGPVWSVDGTAIFGKGLASSNLFSAKGMVFTLGGDGGDVAQAEAANKAIEVKLVLDVSKAGRLSGGGTGDMEFSLVSRPAPPPAGTAVLELMPGNAFLRSVKFKGPWVDKELAFPEMAPQSKRTMLEFGVSKGQSNSVWLTLPQQQIDQGVLVSANATSVWVAPENRAVAYLTDGALIVRPIKEKS